ncbi:MAG: shikimate dehydrogenase [Gammaproteobacteria bacterium]
MKSLPGLDSTKDNYCVIGNPIAHSLSPRIHTLFAEQFDYAISYQAVQVERDEFAEFVQAFFAAGGKGCNVTMPFKEQALAVAGEVTARAQQAAAANTLWPDQAGVIQGDSTDAVGLMRDLADKSIELQDARVLIAGAGGVVKSVIHPLLAAGPTDISIANRTVSRAEAIVADVGGKLSACAYDALAGKQFDLVFNAVSSGLSGGEVLLPDHILADGAVCYDMAYGTAARPFLQWAQRNAAGRALDGLGMLVQQAAESCHIWRGVRPDTDSVLQALQRIHDVGQPGD